MTGDAAGPQDDPLPLENPVWWALQGVQAAGAEITGRAGRFRADLSPFAGLEDPDDPEAWADLARLVGPEGRAVLTGRAVSLPPRWTSTFEIEGVQMVATPAGLARSSRRAAASIIALGEPDVAEMRGLVKRTRPGPFEARTHTLGPYVGVRDGGALVAMAGTRMHPAPYREISAVCTDPDYRGRGLAGRLVTHLAERIFAEGEVPFLHASATNTGAIRVYQALGFEVSHRVVFVDARPGPDGA